jgi:hypothetical protein
MKLPSVSTLSQSGSHTIGVDGWYMIEPLGDHFNAAADAVQVIDPLAAVNIVNRFNSDAESPTFPRMLVDHEHFSRSLSQESRAYGWLMKLENRADGIYGKVRWTPVGLAAVEGREYRFFSTEYQADSVMILNDQKPRRVRPIKLDGLTLTNTPNNRGQSPITTILNRQGRSGQYDDGTPTPLDAFVLLVNRTRARQGLSFCDAWSRSVLSHPLLCRAATEVRASDPWKAGDDCTWLVGFFNRSCNEGAWGAQFDNMAQAAITDGEAAFRYLETKVTNRADAVDLGERAWLKRCDLEAAFERLMAEDEARGIPLRLAWRQVRNNHPVLFNRYVLGL